jgi:hypothetical protein
MSDGLALHFPIAHKFIIFPVAQFVANSLANGVLNRRAYAFIH